jgi:hypothetical protein
MIVARIEGGLGNQLFQYAFGTQLANQHQTELVLDLSAYANKPPHGYLLDSFSIGARELKIDERKRIPERYRTGKGSILNAMVFGKDEFRLLRERRFGFSQKYMRAPDDSYLVGYWQSDRFFRDVESSIRSQFKPSVSLSVETRQIQERMLNSSSIAIHIRRGDYITAKPMAVRNLGLGYYKKCIDMQLERRPNSEVYVFSNDLAWCRENLNLNCPIHFVDHNSTASANEDLWLMTAAESIIIANSTFSWWGAFLGNRRDRIVYAPAHWFHPNTLDDRHLNCHRWLLVGESVLDRIAA